MELKYKAPQTLFPAIADAIRAKTGSEEPIIADNFPEEISKISGNVVKDYEQLINYTMLYNEGDECVDVTGGWSIDGYSHVSSYTFTAGTKNADNMYFIGNNGMTSGQYYNMLGTKNFIDMTEYSRVVFCGKATSILSNTSGVFGITSFVRTNKVIGSSGTTGGYVDFTKTNVLETKSIDVSQSDDMVIVGIMAQINASCKGCIYNVFLTKSDDYITLCSKVGMTAPSSLSELISNTTALSAIFANEDAMNFMAKQCTGDLMVSILNDATARGLLKNSPYLPYIVGNEHWIKFIMMIPDADELLNVTMLYDEGDECEEITGGWSTTGYSWSGLTTNAGTKNESSMSFESVWNAGSYLGTANMIELDLYSMMLLHGKSKALNSDNQDCRTLLLSSKSITTENIKHSIYPFSSSGSIEVEAWDISDVTTQYYVAIGSAGAYSGANRSCEVYNIALLKPDDLSTLCNKIGILTPDSLEAFLEDSTSLSMLMNNPKAIDYLVGCTGDLMIGILQSEAAVSSASEYAKKVLYGHPIWRKFIDMLGVDLIPAPDEYEQIVNYTMLYDEGDECEEVTGGIELYTQHSSTVCTKNATNLHLQYSNNGTYGPSGRIRTINHIDLTQYSKLRATFTFTAGSTNSGAVVMLVQNGTETILTDGFQNQEQNYEYDVDITSYSDAYQIAFCLLGNANAANCSLTVAKILLTKSDDYQTLCTKAGISAPTDLDTLIADTTSLSTIFNNEDAVRFMVAQCTGDFMVGVLNSADAVALLKASPYLNLVIANPHWAKFAMMIPTAKSLLNFTMLYDEGDECTDVTGGWGISGYTFTLGTTLTSGTKNADNMYLAHVAGKVTALCTLKPFVTDDYSLFGAICKPTSVLNRSDGTFGIEVDIKHGKVVAGADSAGGGYHFKKVNVKEVGFVNLSNKNGEMYVHAFAQQDTACKGHVYDVFVTKPDDYQTLCSKAGITAPTDLATLVADSTAMAAIMSNEEAIKYLMGCTGDLMVSILNSTTAVSAIVNSAVATQYLTSHSAWAKFIKMSPTCVDVGLDLLV